MFLFLAWAKPKDGLSAGTCLGERYDDVTRSAGGAQKEAVAVVRRVQHRLPPENLANSAAAVFLAREPLR
jgi:hypothetical protein